MLTERKRPHLPFLDGIRGMAALYVLLHHACLITFCLLWPRPSGLQKGFLFLFSLGHYAVDIFIILSGFSLMIPIVLNEGVLKGGAISFYFKRARRILPPYYLCIIASLLLLYVLPQAQLYRNAKTVTVEDLVTHAFLIHDLWPETAKKINPVLWSIAVEWRIYFTLPLLVILWRKRGPLFTTSLFCIASFLILLVARFFKVGIESLMVISPHYLGLFAIGTLAAGVAFSDGSVLIRWRNSVNWYFAGILGILLSIVVMKYPTIFHEYSFFFNDYIVGCTTVCFLIYLSNSPHVMANRFLSHKWNTFLGTMAYSIYLIHMPLQIVFMNYGLAWLPVSPLIKGVLLMTVGTIVQLAFCYLFFLIGEKPFLNSSRKQPAQTSPLPKEAMVSSETPVGN